MNDPAYRFTVVYKDGRELSQEDENGVVVKDHCHIEDRGSVQIYALRNRPGDHVISVNFETGDFSFGAKDVGPVNVVKMMAGDMDMYMRPFHSKAEFKPLWGRRNFQGEFGHKVFYYCGWETKVDGKKFKRVMYVNDMGEIFFEAS